MIDKSTQLKASLLLNTALLVGGLFFTYEWIDTAVRSDYAYHNLVALQKNIYAQKVLLKNVIAGYEKDRVIELVKKEAAKPENSKMELKINDVSIVLGEIKIHFEYDKIINVE